MCVLYCHNIACLSHIPAYQDDRNSHEWVESYNIRKLSDTIISGSLGFAGAGGKFNSSLRGQIGTRRQVYVKRALHQLLRTSYSFPKPLPT